MISERESDCGKPFRSGDELRTLENVCEKDPRFEGVYHPHHLEPGQLFRIEDHYADAVELRLARGAPEDVQVQWNTALNLFLYSWFVYRFFHIAELQACATLEFALRLRLRKEPDDHGGLKVLLDEAVDQQLLVDEGLAQFQRIREAHSSTLEEMAAWPKEFRIPMEPLPEDRQHFVKNISCNLPRLRNMLAHGTTNLYAQRGERIEVCRDLINQLFRV